MEPPETIVCKYCGDTTASFQLVKQVPVSNCPQAFILETLRGFSGSCLEENDYICFDHEETFGMKYRLQERGLEFKVMHLSKYTKKR